MSSLLELEKHVPLLFPLSFTILVSLIFISYRWIWHESGRGTKPPSPPGLPILGNLHQLGLHPHRSLRTLAQTYGPLMLLHFGRVPVLVVSSAESAREIMKTHDLDFANRPKTSMFEKLVYDCKDVATAPYGEYWRQVRSICVLHLLSNKRVMSYSNVREQETAHMIENVRKSSSLSEEINLSEVFATLTNGVASRVALGNKYGAEEVGRHFKDLLGEFMELIGAYNVGDYIPWLGWISCVNGLDARADRVAKEFDKFLDEVVEDHIRMHLKEAQTESDEEDFVDVLLRIQKENCSGGFSIDRTTIKALILDVFSAGTHTTYTLLEWAMTELLRHPEVMRKLKNEVRRIGNDKSEITEDDLDKMHYLKAVIKETLRMHPPVPLLLPRESIRDVTIKGFNIRAGTQVLTNAWAIGRDPALWDEAEKFWPDRFLNSSINFKGNDFQFIPFGAGRRGCPGIQFAISVDELVLANMVHKFDWALPGEARGEDLDTTESTGITTHRKFPLIAVATPHSS